MLHQPRSRKSWPDIKSNLAPALSWVGHPLGCLSTRSEASAPSSLRLRLQPDVSDCSCARPAPAGRRHEVTDLRTTGIYPDTQSRVVHRRRSDGRQGRIGSGARLAATFSDRGRHGALNRSHTCPAAGTARSTRTGRTREVPSRGTRSGLDGAARGRLQPRGRSRSRRVATSSQPNDDEPPPIPAPNPACSRGGLTSSMATRDD